MGSMSIWHWVVVGIVVLLLFGKGRFSGMMGDVAKGIKEFKKGMSEDDEAKAPASRIEGPAPSVVDAEVKSEKQN
jgi:sec-independent protein translocase protein TatA